MTESYTESYGTESYGALRVVLYDRDTGSKRIITLYPATDVLFLDSGGRITPLQFTANKEGEWEGVK